MTVNSTAAFKLALNDSSVDHVVMEHIEGGYSLTAEEFPPGSLWIENRTVVWEGAGDSPVYVDGNLVGAGCVCRAAPAAAHGRAG